jgi:drug/metabolite transporter (DMT)-like permease
VSSIFAVTSLLIIAGISLLIEPYLHVMSTQFALGIGFGLLASFTFSIYLLVLRSIEKKTPETSPAANLCAICIIGSIILGAAIVYHPEASFSLPPTWFGIFCVLAYSLISQVCGWWLVSKGIGQLSLSLSGVLFLIQPALVFLCDCLIFERNTGLLQIAGCILLLASVYKIVIEEQQRQPAYDQ